MTIVNQKGFGKMSVEYDPIGWAEIRVDTYGGDSCEEHIPYWRVYAEGDRDDNTQSTPLILDLKAFPVGTKVTIEVPVCPECRMARDVCEEIQRLVKNSECSFDWKEWEIGQYS